VHDDVESCNCAGGREYDASVLRSAKERLLVKLIGGSRLHACLWVLGVGLASAAGCAAKRTINPIAGSVNGMAAREAEARVAEVQRDPRAYLHKVAEKCAALEQYTLTFTRQERRGLFRMLREPEVIACKFRRQPFSVYMRWLDPDIKYGESTYVEGQEENKVRFVPRHGLFGLPPRITRVEVQTPVIWGEARYPITDFGLQRMMERTFDSIRRAGDDWTISYEGLTKLSDSDRVVHYLRLEFSTSLFRAPIQELFVDAETDLPTCTRVLYRSGELEAAYVWAEVDPDVELSDDDFLLDAEREQRSEQSQATTVSDGP
jgi:hypothetical protein